MGLFMNRSGHPTIFKNQELTMEPNQEYFKIDPFAEWIKEEKEVILRKLNGLETSVVRGENIQSNQWKVVQSRLNQLIDANLLEESFKCFIVDSLSDLEAENKRLNQVLNQEMAPQIQNINETNKEIGTQLEKFTTLNLEMNDKINEQSAHQKDLTEKISMQQGVQKDLIDRLDVQEGLTEKVLRQVDHLRSILYERTNVIIEKIEDNYTTTTSYIHKLLIGSEQPLTSFIMKQKQEDK